MKKLSQFSTVFFLSLMSASLYAAEPVVDTTANTVKEKVAAIMKQNNIPGVAVELIVDGKPHSYYFGYANQDKKIPVTQKTIFELGSISKIMTSILFAQEIDIANMSLNDPLTKYMPDLSEGFSDVSLQSLATHTSGLPFNAPQNITNITDLHNYLAKWSPEDAPGEQMIYSNFGVGMLGYALESATHKDFNQLYRRHILSPLGMQAIGITVPASLKKYVAQGYDKEGKAVPPSELGVFPAAYAVKASANDMEHFLRAAIGLSGTPDRVFYPMKMTQTAYVKTTDKMQGLGWNIQAITPGNLSTLLNPADDVSLTPHEVEEVFDRPTYDGNALIDKTGSTDGFRAYIAVIPNKKSGIVILANKNVPTSVIMQTARNILFATAKINS